MSAIISKNSQVMIEISGTPTALGSITDWTYNNTRNTIDVSVISTEWKKFAVGQISGDGSFNLIMDANDDDAVAAVKTAMYAGTQMVIHLRPQGTGSGLPEISIPAYITTWNQTAGTEDAIRIAVNFTVADEPTETEQPTV